MVVRQKRKKRLKRASPTFDYEIAILTKKIDEQPQGSIERYALADKIKILKNIPEVGMV